MDKIASQVKKAATENPQQLLINRKHALRTFYCGEYKYFKKKIKLLS